MDVLRTACELAEALLASEAFAAYREAEIEFLNDDTAQDLLGRLEWERARWQAAAVSDPRSAREAWERVRALEADARANAAYARYEAARASLDAFVGLVLDEVSYLISGTTRQDVPCGAGGPPPAEKKQGPAFDLARRLGHQLRETGEYRRLAEAERAFLLDEGVQAWIQELRDAEERLRGLGYASPAEGEALRRRVDELKDRIATRPSHAAFLKAREEFDRLMGLVLDTINLGFTGSQRDEAGCGTAGRSCGCGSGLYLPSPPRIRQLLAVTG